MTRQPSPEVSVRNPRALTADEIDAFCVLIRKGDEVDEAGLPVRVRQAEALACVRVGDRIVGVAALKNTQPGYRQGVFEKAKAAWIRLASRTRSAGYLSKTTSAAGIFPGSWWERYSMN